MESPSYLYKTGGGKSPTTIFQTGCRSIAAALPANCVRKAAGVFLIGLFFVHG